MASCMKYHHIEDKLNISESRFNELGIHHAEYPGERRTPSKDSIKHLEHRPWAKNCQVCFACVPQWKMIWYCLGFANILRSCDRSIQPFVDTLDRAPEKRKTYASEDRKCYWSLDHADMCNHHPLQIVDSGIFSLIAGGRSHDGKNTPEKVRQYLSCYEQYVDHAFEPGVKIYTDNEPYFMDFDSQKLLGVEETRNTRERLIKEHPNTKWIHVYHPHDGLKELERFAKEYDFIAIGSSPMDTDMNTDKVRLAYTAKSFNPDVKIHVLGVNEESCLRNIADVATCCDATSWAGSIMYGPSSMLKVGRGINGTTEKWTKEYVKWVTEESGLLELIRAYFPTLWPMCKCSSWTESDHGWTREKCEMGAWLALDAFNVFQTAKAICGPQALVCKEDHKTPLACFYKGMEKVFNWEKVTDADVERGPYDIWQDKLESVYQHADLTTGKIVKSPDVRDIYCPPDYRHIDLSLTMMA